MDVVRDYGKLELISVGFYDLDGNVAGGTLFGGYVLTNLRGYEHLFYSLIDTFVDACDQNGGLVVNQDLRNKVRVYLRETGDVDRSKLGRRTSRELELCWFNYSGGSSRETCRLIFPEYVGLGRPIELQCDKIYTKTR